MDYAQAIAALAKAGTAQNVKVYRKHGAKGEMFGVSFADLGKLAKQIKKDQGLAEELWDSGNLDARLLAAMIADPARITPVVAERWVRDLDYYCLTDYVAAVVAKSSFARQAMAKWMKSPKEYVQQAGYSILAGLLKDNLGDLTDAELAGILDTIEKEIHSSANRARYAMNSAVIAIGIYRPGLTTRALEAAERIGHVEVDHLDTSCKTPEAVPYIKKALARRK